MKSALRLFCLTGLSALWAFTPAPAQVPVPTTGCYLSAFTPDGQAAFETLSGRPIAIEMFYRAWSNTADFPSSTCNTINAGGAIPHLTWEPWNYDMNSTVYSMQSIISGTHDAYIKRWAQQIRDWKKPLFLRFAHEMNGDWYPWDGTHNGGAVTTGYGSPTVPDGPERYVDAWRHIHRIFDSSGAENVSWIWAPNVMWAPNSALNNIRNYYPGDAFVDWLGIDGYNWGTVQATSTWQAFSRIMKTTYDSCCALGDKPVMVAEFASTENGGNKAAWITDAYLRLKTDFPKIKAVTWFQINKETDWRINSSDAALNAYRAAIADPWFISSVSQVGARPLSRDAGTLSGIEFHGGNTRPRLLITFNGTKIGAGPFPAFYLNGAVQRGTSSGAIITLPDKKIRH